RRRIEAERQKWEPVPGGFFRRLLGGGSSEPKVRVTSEAPAAPDVAAPVAPVPLAIAAVPAPSRPVVAEAAPVVTAPVVTAPGVPLKIISDSSEMARPAAPAQPSPSFFTPAQPTVDPLADQIELIKQRAAMAQGQPQFVQPAVPQATIPQAVQPVPEAAVEQSKPEQPGFWSRVGGFFIRSKKDQQQAAQTAPPQRPAAQWPPNNIVVRDPKAAQAPVQVPAGLAPGGVMATNFPRVQYAPVTNQGNLFLPRALAVQTNLPGMPQPPAAPREVREMRPGKTGTQGIIDLQGNAPIEIIQGRTKAVIRVYATGAGRISPDLNGAELDVGQTYTIEAQPSRGAVFLGWTGSIETNSPVLRFVMRTGTVLSANFQFGYNMERELPEVAILSPAEGTRLASPVFTVQGAARDNLAVARIEFSVNDGPWAVAQGTDSWIFEASARPGANHVHVRAVDQAGNQSQPLLRSFYYSVASPLTVRVNGAGAVEPDWNGRLLDVGGLYEMRATPVAGHVFTGWSGGAGGASPVLQFVMQTNLLLEANFAPRVASLSRGMFNGLVYPTNSLVPARCGFFQLEVGLDGSFTGFLRQGVASHALSGRFDLNGQATASVVRAGLPTLTVSLQLDTVAGERLMGRFIDDGQGVEMFAYRQVFDGRSNPAPLAGRYTFVMPTATNSAASPGGDAFGEIVVDRAGNVKFAGELPDGTPVRHEAVMGRNGLWPLHVPLAGGRGMLLGWITMTNNARLDAFGEVIWHKPLAPQDRYYPYGFSTRRHLFGTLYTPTGGAAISGDRRIGGMLSGGNLDKIVLGDSGLPMTASSPIYQTLQHFAWNFRPDTGFVEGTFIHPTTKQETAFRGALLQKVGWTSGYFLGQNHSGVVHLQLPQ
ncbi:MAG: Ig-like domain-containing protein, partial [Limisphaerales bacterium]